MVDVWVQMNETERQRRINWLQRYSETPLHRLGITEELIELAGLSVTEWSLPPNCPATSIVVQQRGRGLSDYDASELTDFGDLTASGRPPGQ